MADVKAYTPRRKKVTLKHGGYLGFMKKEFSFEMSLIPSGWYWQGSKDENKLAAENERPRHKVKLTRPFWMSMFPVTQELYKLIMGNNPSTYPGILHPVETVSWYDSIRFCNKLSKNFNMKEAYKIGPVTEDETGEEATIIDWDRSVRGFRLPTETEWEFASRAMKTHPFAGGHKVRENCWFEGNTKSGTHMVGLKPPNDWGLYDMSGNVNEWCWDWYAPYTSDGKTDPSGSTSGEMKICRGGSSFDQPKALRVCARHSRAPFSRDEQVGIRVVIDAT